MTLEDIELSNHENSLYVNRLKTNQLHQTVISKNKCTLTIKKCKVIDNGFFSGKCLGFDIFVSNIDLDILREDPDFKWLIQALKKEFPFASIPFLLKSHLKVIF